VLQEVKCCYRCGVVLSGKTGIVRKTGKEAGKFRSDCRRCGAELARSWRKKNPARVLASVKSWKARHPGRDADYKRKAAYGITREQFDRLRLSQTGKCAICKRDFSSGKDQHVDHDHQSGRVRGLLCSGCNTALGLMKDSPERLRAAADYLERPWPVT
jgi:hypothetical protein